MESELSQLKRMYADLALENRASQLRMVMSKDSTERIELKYWITTCSATWMKSETLPAVG